MKSEDNNFLLAESIFPYGGLSTTFEKEKQKREEERNNQKRENYKLYAIRIHNYLTKELSRKDTEKVNESTGNNKNINKISIILLNNGKYLFAINDDYKNAKKILNSSEWWEILIKEIKERGLPPERKTNKQIPKEMVDYFNYNSDKCPIYFKGKYKLTNIFLGKDIDVLINPDIKTEFITEKKYKKRKAK